MSGWRTIDSTLLEAFKRTWPCHGLPDDLHAIAFEFDARGELVDIDARTETGGYLDSSDFDTPALVALAQDAANFGRKEKL